MYKKTTVLLLALMVCSLLSGCLPWSAEDSYQLPRPPLGYQTLTAAVSKARRELELEYNTTVEDVPPSAGDSTSAVQLLDMDDNGTQETAVTFFRVVGAQMPIRICFFTRQPDESYTLSRSIQGEGDSVYAIHYADVDGRPDSDGINRKEVIVSWQLGGQANYLGIYTIDAGSSQTLATFVYDSYRLTDLDQDGRTEVATAVLNRETSTGVIRLYDWTDADTLNVQEVPLSSDLFSIRLMRANYLKDFIPALYVVGDRTDGSTCIDVISIKGGVPVNLSLDPESLVSRECSSFYRDLTMSDVNSDNILDVPRPWQLNTYGAADGAWLTDWVQYDSRGRTGSICTTYHCVADGWYLVIPDNWKNRLVIYRNDSVSGQRAVVFAISQGEEKEPLPFLSIYKLTGASRTLRATSGNRFILAEDSSTIYAATFYNTWDCGLDQNSLLENFRLIFSSWTGE